MKMDNNMIICIASAVALVAAIALMVIKPKNDTDGVKLARNKKIAYALIAVGLVGCGAGAYLMMNKQGGLASAGSPKYYYF